MLTAAAVWRRASSIKARMSATSSRDFGSSSLMNVWSISSLLHVCPTTTQGELRRPSGYLVGFRIAGTVIQNRFYHCT
jgi:hypothetical protein